MSGVTTEVIKQLMTLCSTVGEAAEYLGKKVRQSFEKAGLKNMMGTADTLDKLALDLYDEDAKAQTAAWGGAFKNRQVLREPVNLDALKAYNEEELAKNTVQLMIQIDPETNTWERNYAPEDLNPDVCSGMDQLLLAWIAENNLSRQEHRMYRIPEGQDEIDIEKSTPLDEVALKKAFNDPKNGFVNYVHEQTKGQIRINPVQFSGAQLQPTQQQQSGSSK